MAENPSSLRKKGGLRSFLWVMGIVFALLLAMGAGAVVFVNTRGAKMVEDYITQKTGFPVSADVFTIDILRGRVELKNFKIKNPPALGGAEFVSLPSAVIEVDPLSLLGNTVRVRELTVHADKIAILKTSRGTNAELFAKALNPPPPAVAAKAGKTASSPAQSPAQKSPSKIIAVDHLKLQIDRVGYMNPSQGDTTPKVINLGFDFERKNVADASALGPEITGEVVADVISNGGIEMVGGLTKGILNTGGGSVQKLEGAVKSLKNFFK